MSNDVLKVEEMKQADLGYVLENERKRAEGKGYKFVILTDWKKAGDDPKIPPFHSIKYAYIQSTEEGKMVSIVEKYQEHYTAEIRSDRITLYTDEVVKLFGELMKQ